MPLASQRMLSTATLLLFTGFALGCGSSDSGSDPLGGEPVGCPELRLAASAAMPLERIGVEGIPPHFEGYLAAKVTADDGAAASVTLVARMEDSDEIVLHAPIHPMGLAEGGEVMVEIADEKGRACEPVAFRVLPLPAAPGATQALYDGVGKLIEGQARYFETTLEELRDATAEELPAHLLPLYLAQHSHDDPENPNSFQALLAGTAPDLEGVDVDLDLLDRLLAHLGLLAGLDESLERLDQLLDDEGETSGIRRMRSGLHALSGPKNAFQLDAEMEMAQWARSFQGDTGLAEATRGLASGVGLLGLVPVPQVKAGSMVAGTGLFTFLKATEAASKLLPSRFVSLDFELSPPSFAEDDPSTGHWHNVMVVAASEGWELDRAILESLLQLVKVKGGYDGWINRFAPKGFMSSLGNHLRNRAVGSVIGLSADGSDILSIPPAETEPIDITEDPWSFAEVSYVLEQDGREGYRLDASWEGDDVGEIQIGTALGSFGGQHLYTRKTLTVEPLSIRIEPNSVAVEPGETVEFRVDVPNAHDGSLSFHAENGMIVVQRQADGSYQVRYTAPDTQDGLPDILTATSESESGLLSNPSRRKPFAVAGIRSTNAFIEISPAGICVKSKETQTFVAEVFNLDDDAVRWEATHGTISSSGDFKAPEGSGTAVITATSVWDEGVSASISVRFGSCLCNWSARMSGGSLSSFGGSQFSLTAQEGRLTTLAFGIAADSPLFPAALIGDIEGGPLLGHAGSGAFSFGGSYRVEGLDDSEAFGTIAPLLLSLEEFAVQDGKLRIRGNVQGTIYWESIRDERPEEEDDWPGTFEMSFDGTLDAHPFVPEIFSCDPFG